MIGFIDSGVGGLNVVVECSKIFNEDFIFLCDNKNSPYGNKSKKKLKQLTQNNINYLINHYHISMCVLACNTLSFCVGKELQEYFSIPIILMQLNSEKINNLKKDVLFFATKNTIKNNKIIKNKLQKNGYNALYIRNLPLNIDKNINNLNNLNKILKKHLLNKKFKNTKTVVLGCTHFKTIKNNIKSILNNVEFYEYEQDVAKLISTMVISKDTSTYHIVLTDYNYKQYLHLKNYLYANLHKD